GGLVAEYHAVGGCCWLRDRLDGPRPLVPPRRDHCEESLRPGDRQAQPAGRQTGAELTATNKKDVATSCDCNGGVLGFGFEQRQGQLKVRPVSFEVSTGSSTSAFRVGPTEV